MHFGSAKLADRRRTKRLVELAEHVAVLSVWRFRERRVDRTVREFSMNLARLGGHQNRKQDGHPGWLTLRRGWNKLQQMVDYAVKAGVEKM